MVTSWFAKPVYCESGNSSILLLSTKFISLKRYQVAYTVWGRVVQVRILVGRPSFVPLADVVIAPV